MEGLSEIGFSEAMLRGGIIGSVELVDVVEQSASPWFFGPVGFVLRNPKPCKFIPMKGQLGFFNRPEMENVSHDMEADCQTYQLK